MTDDVSSPSGEPEQFTESHRAGLDTRRIGQDRTLAANSCGTRSPPCAASWRDRVNPSWTSLTFGSVWRS